VFVGHGGEEKVLRGPTSTRLLLYEYLVLTCCARSVVSYYTSRTNNSIDAMECGKSELFYDPDAEWHLLQRHS